MTRLRFTKGENNHLFPLRDIKSEIHALKIGDNYIDLTTNINLTSFPQFHFNIENTVYYLRNRYFNSNTMLTGNFFNKAYKPSRPIKHILVTPLGTYQNYKISIKGNFDVNAWFDYNNSSYFSCSHFKGSFADTVVPIDGGGHRWSGYDVTKVNDPADLDMSYPVDTMNGEINLTGNISELKSIDKQIFYRNMTNITGEGARVNFRVYARVDSGNLIVTYGWWLDGYDERCNGNVSYSIKVGACMYE